MFPAAFRISWNFDVFPRNHQWNLTLSFWAWAAFCWNLQQNVYNGVLCWKCIIFSRFLLHYWDHFHYVCRITAFKAIVKIGERNFFCPHCKNSTCMSAVDRFSSKKTVSLFGKARLRWSFGTVRFGWVRVHKNIQISRFSLRNNNVTTSLAPRMLAEKKLKNV